MMRAIVTLDFTYTGCDRPALKLLNRHVRKSVSFMWYDLGLELLEQEDEDDLDEIKKNHDNSSECCREMFQLWLRKYSNATWLHLIKALREVDLNTLANKIEGMLMPMEETILHTNTGTHYVCMYVCMDGCMYVCMYVRMYICMYM